MTDTVKSKTRYKFTIYCASVVYEDDGERFNSHRAAVKHASAWVRACRKKYRYRTGGTLSQVGSFKNLDRVDLRIGGRQEEHPLYSSAIITTVNG